MDASVENIPSSPTLISNRENKKNANVPDLNCVGGLSIATNQQSLAEQQGPGQLDILIPEIAEGGLYSLYTRRHKFRIFSWHPQTSLPLPPRLDCGQRSICIASLEEPPQHNHNHPTVTWPKRCVRDDPIDD